VSGTPGFRLTRQCDECPWRTDVPVGRFSPDRYVALRLTVEQGFNSIFACHKTKDDESSACVGFLLVDGVNNWNMRLAAALGMFKPSELEASGPLYESFAEMAKANGVDLDALPPVPDGFAERTIKGSKRRIKGGGDEEDRSCQGKGRRR
jgi:hypothetical protein